jgi:hypothetical protein
LSGRRRVDIGRRRHRRRGGPGAECDDAGPCDASRCGGSLCQSREDGRNRNQHRVANRTYHGRNTTSIVPGPSTPERFRIRRRRNCGGLERRLCRSKADPISRRARSRPKPHEGQGTAYASSGGTSRLGQPETNEETATQMAHQDPSDSSRMTMNADVRLSRGAVRRADSRGFRAG